MNRQIITGIVQFAIISLRATIDCFTTVKITSSNKKTTATATDYTSVLSQRVRGQNGHLLLDPSADGPCFQGATETLLKFTMRLSINHTHQCICDVKSRSRILRYSKNCASQRQTDFTINRLNSNKKSVKGLGTPRGGQGGQNPPKLLGLAGEKFLKINKIFKLGIPGRFCWQMAQLSSCEKIKK